MAPRTSVLVRAMPVVWQVFPAFVEGKSQAQFVEELGVSRQFVSRQVIDSRSTFKLRWAPRRMRVRRWGGAGAAIELRG